MFALQKVQRVPREAHDYALKAVITEEGLQTWYPSHSVRRSDSHRPPLQLPSTPQSPPYRPPRPAACLLRQAQRARF
jgi:hypothetical protein